MAKQSISLSCLLAVLVQTFLVLAVDSQFCSSAGRCQGVPKFAQLQESSPDRALSCPASDCDGTGTLKHHLVDQNVGQSVACLEDVPNPKHTEDNGFLRCFSGSLLCSAERIIESVVFGTHYLQGGNLEVSVNLRKGGSTGCDSPDDVASVYEQSPVATVTVDLSPGVAFTTEVSIPSAVTLSPTESLLVEIRAPSMAGVGEFFVADSKDGASQCDPSYLQTNSCKSTGKPFDTTSIGFEEVSFIISVNTKTPPVILSFTLINADDNTDIVIVENGDTIFLPSSSLNLRVDIEPSRLDSIEKVGFVFGTEIADDLQPPFALGGDDSGDYNPTSFLESVGSKAITVQVELGNGEIQEVDLFFDVMTEPSGSPSNAPSLSAAPTATASETPSTTPSKAPSAVPTARPAPTATPSTAPVSNTPTPAPQLPSAAGRPVPAPPEFCFSGCSLVVIKGVGEVPIHQVKVGDYLLTGSGQFSRVFSLAHYQPDVEAKFIQIYTDDEEPLEMTGDHLIFMNGTAIRASGVQIGDSLGHRTVTRLTKVKRRGVYAPLTEAGDLIVNGIQVSSYVGILEETGAVWNQHVLGHLLFSPVRMFCRWHPQSCVSEVHDETGFSNLYSWLIWVIVWVGRRGKTVSFLVSATAAPVLVAFWVLEQICQNSMAATALAMVPAFLLFVRKIDSSTKSCRSGGNRIQNSRLT